MPENYPGMKSQMLQQPCGDEKETAIDHQFRRVNEVLGVLEHKIEDLFGGLVVMPANKCAEAQGTAPHATGTIELELSAIVGRIELSIDRLHGLNCNIEPMVGRIKLLG